MAAPPGLIALAEFTGSDQLPMSPTSVFSGDYTLGSTLKNANQDVSFLRCISPHCPASICIKNRFLPPLDGLVFRDHHLFSFLDSVCVTWPL